MAYGWVIRVTPVALRRHADPRAIHGTVSLKDAFLHARPGLMRQPAMFLPGEFSPPMPIHVWVIEHEGRRILVDTGGNVDVHDLPFCRFYVRPEDELRAQLAEEVDTVVLTHMHGDHVDGCVHWTARCWSTTPSSPISVAGPRIQAKPFRQPVPWDVDFRPLSSTTGRSAASPPARADRRGWWPSHAGPHPGHMSIIAIDDEGGTCCSPATRTDSLEQLRARRHRRGQPEAEGHGRDDRPHPRPRREHPTVYLPSHDPSRSRGLAAGTTL